MRIAIFQDTYHPTVNGVVTSTNLFIRGLQARGHEALLVVPKHAKHTADTYKDVPDHVVLVEAVDASVFYPDAYLGKFWRPQIGQRIRAFKPDVIHSMTEFTLGHWAASYWRSVLGVKRVHTFHTLWTEYLFYVPLLPEFISQPLVRYLAPRVTRRFDALITPSELMRDAVVNDWGVKMPVDVVPTGVDLSQFAQVNSERFRARHNIGPRERVILYLGRMGNEKNVELAVDTMAELRRRGEPGLRFVIAGSGPKDYMDRLHKHAAQLGLDDAIWTGFVKGQDWLDCYGAADIVLFPSVTETQGLVVIEALAAGKPLVSVEAMGPASTMKGERGCLFAANDKTAFADATQRLLHDDVLYQRKRREALELARACSLERRTAELEAVYERVLGRSSLVPKMPDESRESVNMRRVPSGR